jgi:hypothetical protein
MKLRFSSIESESAREGVRLNEDIKQRRTDND